MYATTAVVATLACLLGTSAAASGDVQANPHGAISAINGAALLDAGPALWGPQMTAIQQQGVQEVRSDAAWNNIQPQPPGVTGPVWQWSRYDPWVLALASHGLTWQPILDYNSSFASAALSPQAFAAFAQAVAARYGANGTFWAQNPQVPYLPARIFEIWNEENVSTPYYMNPASYGQLYMAARRSIKTVDPSASVDIGGLGEGGSPNYNPDGAGQYLAAMLLTTPGLKGTIDAVALHPYGGSAADSVGWVVHFRHMMSGLGVPYIPLDLTEFGFIYAADRESWRASQMTALGDRLSRSNCGVRLTAPYDWINPDNAHDWGFVDPADTTGELRPAGMSWFSAFAQGGTEPTLATC
jgi:hypothetical protein